MKKRTSRALIAVCALAITALTVAGVPARRRAVVPVFHGLFEVHHVVVIILENTDAPNALRQPFLKELTARGALLSKYHALTHPSQPNYIALVAGSAYGIATDNSVTIDVPHLGDLLEQHGMNWKVYAENYPGSCYLGKSSGNYVRRHVPFLSFANVQNDRSRCNTNVVDATTLDADVATNSLPQFALYVPNLKNDGHDTGVAVADSWLRQRFGPLFDDPRLADTLFVITFDEGSSGGPNIVYCCLVGAGVVPGATSADYYDHYSLLRTIEDAFYLGTLHHHDETADPIRGIWR